MRALCGTALLTVLLIVLYAVAVHFEWSWNGSKANVVGGGLVASSVEDGASAELTVANSGQRSPIVIGSQGAAASQIGVAQDSVRALGHESGLIYIGTCMQGNGQPLEGVMVEILDLSRGREAAEANPYRGHTGAGGQFHLQTDISGSGTVLCGLSKHGYTTLKVTASAAPVNDIVDLGQRFMPPAGSLHGQVRDTTGNGLEGINVSMAAIPVPDDHKWGLIHNRSTGVDGLFLFEDVPAIYWNLRVSDPRWSMVRPVHRRLEPGTEEHVVLEVERSPAVSGALVTAAGEAVSGARVVAVNDGDGHRVTARALSDEMGRFELYGRAGDREATLTLSLESHYYQIAQRDTRYQWNDEGLSVTVAAKSSIRALVMDARSGLAISNFEYALTARPSDDGVIRSAPAGASPVVITIDDPDQSYLHVYPADDGLGFSESIDIRPFVDSEQVLTVELEAASQLRFVVQDEAGLPVTGVMVLLVELNDRVEVDQMLDVRWATKPSWVSASGDGSLWDEGITDATGEAVLRAPGVATRTRLFANIEAKGFGPTIEWLQEGQSEYTITLERAIPVCVQGGGWRGLASVKFVPSGSDNTAAVPLFGGYELTDDGVKDGRGELVAPELTLKPTWKVQLVYGGLLLECGSLTLPQTNEECLRLDASRYAVQDVFLDLGQRGEAAEHAVLTPKIWDESTAWMTVPIVDGHLWINELPIGSYALVLEGVNIRGELEARLDGLSSVLWCD